MSEEDEHWMGQYSAESQVIAVVVTILLLVGITAGLGLGFALYLLITL